MGLKKRVTPSWKKIMKDTFHKLHRQKRKLAAKPELHVLTFTSGNCLDILQKFHSIKALLPPLEDFFNRFSFFRLSKRQHDKDNQQDGRLGNK